MKSKVEACMICAPDPCECFAPRAKKPAPRKRPAVEAVSEQVAPEPTAPEPTAPRQDLRAKMKAAAAAAPTFKPEPPVARRRAVSEGGLLTEGSGGLSGTSRPAPRPTLSDEQLLENAALRALADIMAPEEQERYRMIINSTPSAAERKAEWKARRAWQLQEQ